MHWFIGGDQVVEGEMRVQDRKVIHHINTVLHLTLGEELVVGDGHGVIGAGKIVKITEREIFLNIESRKIVQSYQPRLVVYMALLKRDNFEWVVQKAAEIGVSTIVPLVTERTIKLRAQPERWSEIAREAMEQSHQAFIPEILEPKKFTTALVESEENVRLFFQAGGENFSGACAAIPRTVESVSLWIGPEGGWSDGEAAEAYRHGCKAISLGESVLRAETAAVAASFMLAEWRRSLKK